MQARQQYDGNALDTRTPPPRRAVAMARVSPGLWPLELRLACVTGAATALWIAIYAAVRVTL